MKIINRRSLTVLLTLALLLATTIGITVAYFSDTDSAEGKAAVVLKHETTVEEGEGPEKQIAITNSKSGAAVVVRLQVFGPDEPLMTVTLPDNGYWTKSESDGWYYYTKVLAAGATTEGKILAKIKDNLTAEEKAILGDNFNVTVAHEARLVVYNGTSVVTPADWDQSITFTEK